MKTQSIIQQITGMDDEAYYRTIFETGISYLDYEVFYDANLVSTFSQTPEYWEFWKKTVASRNTLFVNQFNESPLTKQELRYIYEALLDVRSLSIYPPDHNWSDGYNNYITDLIRKTHTKKHTPCL